MLSVPVDPKLGAKLLAQIVLRRRSLGGSGSGNFGHAGRPGEVGGSGTGDGTVGKADFRRGDIEKLNKAAASAVAAMLGVDTKEALDSNGKNFDSSTLDRGAIKQSIVAERGEEFYDKHPEYGADSVDEHGGDPWQSADEFVQYQLDNWAETSGDHDMVAINRQFAARDEFGLKDAETNHFTSSNEKIARRSSDYEYDKAYARLEYEATQKFFKDNGITHVTVYRGMKNGPFNDTNYPSLSEHVIAMQPLSSWTFDLNIANDFAGDEGVVFATRVPVKHVQSTFFTGRGCADEKELILHGGRYNVKALGPEEGPLHLW